MALLTNRRGLLAGGAALGFAGPVSGQDAVDVSRYRTPYKYGKLVLSGSGVPGTFDSRSVDDPFVFPANGRFYMTYLGYDGTGYQTGLAQSDDLVNWTKAGILLARDPRSPVTRYNIAMASILRENDLFSPGRPKKVRGRYLGVWNAYPAAGYEEGAAVIGLAWSDDLMHWTPDPAPILTPENAAPWEAGGLYKSYILQDGDTFYLFYNAKTAGKGWKEQSGVAVSTDLKTWKRYSGNPLITNGPPGGMDDRFASNPFVVRDGDRWVMFYYGYSTDHKARDLVAVGDTLLSFRKAFEPLIEPGPPGTVDEKFAHKPALFHHDGALYHFYCAVSGQYPNDTRGISVARSKPW